MYAYWYCYYCIRRKIGFLPHKKALGEVGYFGDGGRLGVFGVKSVSVILLRQCSPPTHVSCVSSRLSVLLIPSRRHAVTEQGHRAVCQHYSVSVTQVKGIRCLVRYIVAWLDHNEVYVHSRSIVCIRISLGWGASATFAIGDELTYPCLW